MLTHEKYLGEAIRLGFSRAVAMEDLDLLCEAELRAYCNPEQCSNYGTTWVCPPGCGSLEECQQRISAYNIGIVLQSISTLPEDDKWNAISEYQREHNGRFLRLADIARSDNLDVLPLTTGGCIVCSACSFPDSPCLEPDRKMHSLSAYGINVSLLCKKAELDYSFRNDMVYFTACLMLRTEHT